MLYASKKAINTNSRSRETAKQGQEEFKSPFVIGSKLRRSARISASKSKNPSQNHTINVEIPPNRSILEDFPNFDIQLEAKESDLEEFEDTTEELPINTPEILNHIVPPRITPTNQPITNNNHQDIMDTSRKQNDELRIIPMFRGKSPLVAKEVLTSIESMRITYQWDDDTTIRKLFTKLKGTKLREWLLTVKQLPNTNKWDAVKSAFERNYIRMSHTKRWKKLRKLKQSKTESLEMYRGRLEELVEPAEMNEKEKVNLFIIGLRKYYRRKLRNASNYQKIADVIDELREDDEIGSSSEEEDDSDSDSSSSSEDSNSSSSDDDYKKKKKKIKKKKKKKINKKDDTQRQLRELQLKFKNMMRARNDGVFAVMDNQANPNMQLPFSNVSRYQDMRTTTGVDVCGRCQRAGHKNLACPRNNMQCRRCNRSGHVVPECRVQLPNYSNGRNSTNNGSRMNNPMNNLVPMRNFNNNSTNPSINNNNVRQVVCFRCGQAGHTSRNCQTNNNNIGNGRSGNKNEGADNLNG